ALLLQGVSGAREGHGRVARPERCAGAVARTPQPNIRHMWRQEGGRHAHSVRPHAQRARRAGVRGACPPRPSPRGPARRPPSATRTRCPCSARAAHVPHALPMFRTRCPCSARAAHVPRRAQPQAAARQGAQRPRGEPAARPADGGSGARRARGADQGHPAHPVPAP
ncbi:unnamed protein product, partial [Closterium sp. Yama58-4]